MSEKRARTEDDSGHQLVKRARPDTSTALTTTNNNDALTTHHQSKLAAPTLALSGHSGGVTVCRFNATGDLLATGSEDGTLRLWPIFDREIKCRASPDTGHSRAVTDLCWSTNNDSRIFTSSGDGTAAMVDISTNTRIKRWRHHYGAVNSVDSDGDTLVTVSDDRRCLVYDTREPKNPRTVINSGYQLSACCLSQTTHSLYVSGVEGVIHGYDTRAIDKGPLLTLAGHGDIVTSLSLGHQSQLLVSNGWDDTVRLWDVRPFTDTVDRCLLSLTGARHDGDGGLVRASMSPDSSLIAAGSADRNVYVWDAQTGELRYCLPGHKGVVYDCRFHPSEPILASASADRRAIVGEL